MNKLYQKAVLQMMKTVKQYQECSKSKNWLNLKLKEDMKSAFPLFTVKEIARIREHVVRERENKLEDIIDSTVKLVGQIERHSDGRNKKQNNKEMLHLDLNLRGFPVVFWLCSKHSNPADMHARIQGKLYADRYWYKKLSDAGAEDWLLVKVKDYITKNKIMSIQYIQGPPYYLGTRPYCKHRFEPIDLMSVLTMDKKELEKRAIKTYGRMVKRGEAYDYVKHGIGIK